MDGGAAVGTSSAFTAKRPATPRPTSTNPRMNPPPGNDASGTTPPSSTTNLRNPHRIPVSIAKSILSKWPARTWTLAGRGVCPNGFELVRTMSTPGASAIRYSPCASVRTVLVTAARVNVRTTFAAGASHGEAHTTDRRDGPAENGSAETARRHACRRSGHGRCQRHRGRHQYPGRADPHIMLPARRVVKAQSGLAVRQTCVMLMANGGLQPGIRQKCRNARPDCLRLALRLEGSRSLRRRGRRRERAPGAGPGRREADHRSIRPARAAVGRATRAGLHCDRLLEERAQDRSRMDAEIHAASISRREATNPPRKL